MAPRLWAKLAVEKVMAVVVILIAFQNDKPWINLGGDVVADTVRAGEWSDNHGYVKQPSICGFQLGRRARGNRHYRRGNMKVPHAHPVTPQRRQGRRHDCGCVALVLDPDRDGDLAAGGPNALKGRGEYSGDYQIGEEQLAAQNPAGLDDR